MDASTAIWLMQIMDELVDSNEKTRLVMECLEAHLPEYFEKKYSEKIRWKVRLKETLIAVEQALVQKDLVTMISHLNITKQQRKELLKKERNNSMKTPEYLKKKVPEEGVVEVIEEDDIPVEKIGRIKDPATGTTFEVVKTNKEKKVFDKDLFIVTHVHINEIGILPYYTRNGSEIYFSGTKEECEEYLENLCNSCCQLLDGKKTDFCKDCVNHKWYVHR